MTSRDDSASSSPVTPSVAATVDTASPVSINNRYTIVRTVGEGGMGAIFLAEDIMHENRLVALKHIREECIHKELLQTFKLEFDIMTRLHHPNLVRVYDFGFDMERHTHFITMEYVDGLSIREILRTEGVFPEDRAVSLLIDLCRAVQFIHSRKIIHRDINPSNILLTGTGTVKLMDFGLADLGRSDHKSKGTLLYMAPEVLNGNVDRRIDVFALGCTFYEMLNNVRFFGTDEPKTQFLVDTLLHRDRFHEMHSLALDKINHPVLRAVVGKMTRYNPDERFGSCVEVIDALNRELGSKEPFETSETKVAYIVGAGFVGRNQELLRFRERIDTPESPPKALWIQGDAGVGKSRLFNEFKKYCQMQGYLFLEGSCYEHVQKQFGPFLPIIGELLLQADGTLTERYGSILKKVLPDHCTLKETAPAPQQDPRTDHILLIRTLVDFVIASVQRYQRPCILYLNDIQWSDEGSVEVIDALLKKMKADNAPEGAGARFQPHLYLSSRMEGSEVLAHIQSKDQLEIVHLQPFTETSVCLYMEAVFGENALGSKLRASIPEINRKVGGNPFYLQELTKSLVTDDGIVRKSQFWELERPLESMVFPLQLKELVVAHLRRLQLSDHEQRIVGMMALLDRAISWNELNQLIPTAPRFLDRLEQQEILKTEYYRGCPVYRMAHHLIRETAAERIPDMTAAHEVLADTLESIHATDRDQYVEELAHHFFHARNVRKARAYLELALDRTSRLYENKKVLSLCDQLISILAGHETDKKAGLLVKKAWTLWIMGNMDVLVPVCRQAIAYTESVNDILRGAEAYCLLGMGLVTKFDASCVAAFEKSYALAESVGHKGICARSLGQIGYYYCHSRTDYDKAHEYLERSFSIAEQDGNVEGVFSSLGNRALVYGEQGNFAQAIEYTKRALNLMTIEKEKKESTINPATLKRNYALSHGCLGHYYNIIGDYESALSYSNQGAVLAEEGGNTGIVLYNLYEKAKALFNLGRLFEAEKVCARAESIIPEISYVQDIFKIKILAAKVSHALGDTETGKRELNALLENTGDKFEIAELHYELWKMGNDDAHHAEALRLHREICEKIPEFDFKTRLSDLEKYADARTPRQNPRAPFRWRDSRL